MTNDIEETGTGIRHAHRWEPAANRSALQTAHDRLRWDVSRSRILAVDGCSVCGELRRESVVECAVEGCAEHPICARPYR